MINQQLLDYIKQQLQQGVSPDNIKIALRSNGWGDEDINEAFNNLAMSSSSVAPGPINQISKPKGVRVISILYFLGSLLALGFGVLAIFGGSLFIRILGAAFFGKFFSIAGIIFMALGILGISTGIGLWKYRNWARWIAIFFSLVGIIVSVISIFKGNVSSNIFSVAVSSIIGGYLFFSPKVKAAFEPEKGFVPMNKKLLWIFLILLFLVVGIATVYGLQATVTVTPDKTSIQTPPTNSPIITSVPTPTQMEGLKVSSPKEAYLIMKAEENNIKSYEDEVAFILKYGSKAQIAKLEANKKQVESLPKSLRDQLATIGNGPLVSEITTIQETVNGNTATLNIQTTKRGLTGVITLVLEDGTWKLESESWKQEL